MELTDAEVAQELTDIYRTATGTMVLRPLQGRAALTSTMVPSGLPGLFTNLSVGLGKVYSPPSLCCCMAESGR